MHLLAISEDGSVPGYGGARTAELSDVLRHTADLYSRVGFSAPWISYLAVDGVEPVGICSFKSPPVHGRVEIAYFTFPEFEGRGIATEMASRLIAMTRSWPDSLSVVAQTMPEWNASHRILEKLGFELVGPIEHAQDGVVLEWRLMGRAGA
jgi:RimJ/RimL family protein N-acetyltransferase